MGWWVSLSRKEEGFRFQRIAIHEPGSSPGMDFGKSSIDRVRCELGIINCYIKSGVVSKEAYRRVDVWNNTININKKEKRTNYWALGYSGRNRENIKRCTRQNNHLLSIDEVITRSHVYNLPPMPCGLLLRQGYHLMPFGILKKLIYQNSFFPFKYFPTILVIFRVAWVEKVNDFSSLLKVA